MKGSEQAVLCLNGGGAVTSRRKFYINNILISFERSRTLYLFFLILESFPEIITLASYPNDRFDNLSSRAYARGVLLGAERS